MAEKQRQDRVEFTLRLERQVYEALDAIREREGTPVQRIIERAIRKYLDYRKSLDAMHGRKKRGA